MGTGEADRIEALIAAMTLVEKIGQLTLGTADLVSGPRPSTVGMTAIREGWVGTVSHHCGAPDGRARSNGSRSNRAG